MKIFEALEQGRRWNEDERLLLTQVDRLAEEVIGPNAAGADEKTGRTRQYQVP
jgi:hypothetical protein